MRKDGPIFQVGDLVELIHREDAFWRTKHIDPKRGPFEIDEVVDNPHHYSCACGATDGLHITLNHCGDMPRQWLILKMRDGKILLSGQIPSLLSSEYFKLASSVHAPSHEEDIHKNK